MELVRMKLADLRPNDANLRVELSGIDELADLLDLTPGAPGEPVLPLVAVRGGRLAGLNATQGVVERYYDGDRFDLDAKEFLQRADVEDNDLPLVANAWMCVYAWCRIDHMTNDECDCIYDGDERWDAERAARSAVDVLTALERDGYVPDEGEKAFKSLCEKRLAAWKKKGE